MKRTILYIITLLGLMTACQQDPEIPIVSMSVKDKVEAEWTDASISGDVNTNTKIESFYMLLSTNESMDNAAEVETKYDEGKFTLSLPSLVPQTTYYYQYKAANKFGSYNDGKTSTFKTKDYATPTITTSAVTDISDVSATCGGNVTSDGGLTITERGICYATTNNPTTSDDKVLASSLGTGSFSCTLTDLTEDTTYYVRAYAINSKGTSYGECQTFTTTAYTTPIVTTSAVTDITYTSAIGGGNVTSDGGLTITERGICYATTNNPTTSNSKVIAITTGTGSFSCNLTDLSVGTTYYVRAYATNAKGTSYGESLSFTTGLITFSISGVSFTMVSVQGGTFTMGATSEQGSDAESDESPAHQVTLSDYYIGQTEVTQGLWQAVMGSNPSYFTKGDSYPVEQVSWEECQTFISKLNSMLSSELGSKRFALPTEAQWEYAARGGNKSQGYKYSGSNSIDDVAWYTDNSGSATHPVVQKQANELGLYDMSGNVFEWCQDWWGSYSSSAQTNPTGPDSGSDRVARGGSWNGSARGCRVSNRNSFTPSIRSDAFGLRLVLIP